MSFSPPAVGSLFQKAYKRVHGRSQAPQDPHLSYAPDEKYWPSALRTTRRDSPNQQKDRIFPLVSIALESRKDIYSQIPKLFQCTDWNPRFTHNTRSITYISFYPNSIRQPKLQSLLSINTHFANTHTPHFTPSRYFSLIQIIYATSLHPNIYPYVRSRHKHLLLFALQNFKTDSSCHIQSTQPQFVSHYIIQTKHTQTSVYKHNPPLLQDTST